MSDEKTDKVQPNDKNHIFEKEEMEKENNFLNDVDKKEQKTKSGVFKEKEAGVEKVAEKDNDYYKILSKIKKKTTKRGDKERIESDAKRVSEKADAESRIHALVNLATSKGVVHAVKVARHLDDNYVLDELHDRLLADKLHDILVEKGMI